MKQKIVGKFILAICTLWVSVAVQADQLDDIKHRGKLVCGVLATDEPFSFLNPQNRSVAGYEVDLCREVAKTIGVQAELKTMVIASRIPELLQGHIDILLAELTHDKQREQILDFSSPIFVTRLKMMVRQDSGITALNQLSGKKVVVVKGTTVEQLLKAKVPGVQVLSFDTNPQAILAFNQGKGAAYVNDETSLLKNYMQLGEPARKSLQILPTVLFSEPLAIGVRKQEPRLLAQVNQTLQQLEQSGAAEKLFMRWFGPHTLVNMPKREFKIGVNTVQ